MIVSFKHLHWTIKCVAIVLLVFLGFFVLFFLINNLNGYDDLGFSEKEEYEESQKKTPQKFYRGILLRLFVLLMFLCIPIKQLIDQKHAKKQVAVQVIEEPKAVEKNTQIAQEKKNRKYFVFMPLFVGACIVVVGLIFFVYFRLNPCLSPNLNLT